MTKRKPFPVHLKELGIDPESWATARAGETDELADYRLARDLEDLVESACYDRNIEMREGETLLDMFALLWAAMGRWPLSPAAA